MKNKINDLRLKYWENKSHPYPGCESPLDLEVRIGYWRVNKNKMFTQAQMLCRQARNDSSPLCEQLWNRANYLLTGCIISDNENEFWGQF